MRSVHFNVIPSLVHWVAAHPDRLAKCVLGFGGGQRLRGPDLHVHGERGDPDLGPDGGGEGGGGEGQEGEGGGGGEEERRRPDDSHIKDSRMTRWTSSPR